MVGRGDRRTGLRDQGDRIAGGSEGIYSGKGRTLRGSRQGWRFCELKLWEPEVRVAYRRRMSATASVKAKESLGTGMFGSSFGYDGAVWVPDKM